MSTTVGNVALLKAPQDSETIPTASSPSLNRSTSWSDIATLRQSVIDISEASSFTAPSPSRSEPVNTIEGDFAV
ncbi:MAG: hypothetical protein ACRDRD_11410, partial [Pseudonocardiaceae bacterium]